MCSDSLQQWCESLANDLKDLYVPDLSVCDQLIATDFLSGDDWEVLRKTKRGKSRVKRLIKILRKRDDPKSAFTALAKCIALHHEHLSGTVKAALARFPDADVKRTVNRQGVEHNENVSSFGNKTGSTGIRTDYRAPVQHDEAAISHYSPSTIDDNNSVSASVENEISNGVTKDCDTLAGPTGSGEHTEDTLCVEGVNYDYEDLNENRFKLSQPSSALAYYDERISDYGKCCPQTILYEDHNNDFPIRNEREITGTADILDNGQIENVFKGHGIQCTDQEPSNLNNTFDEISFNEYCSIKRISNNEPTESLDFVDGAMGFTNMCKTPGNLESDTADTANDNVSHQNNGLDHVHVGFDTRNVVKCSRNWQIDTTETINTSRNEHSSRQENKCLKHLLYHLQTDSTFIEEKLPKCSVPAKTINNDIYSNSNQGSYALTEQSHPLEKRARDEGTSSKLPVSNDQYLDKYATVSYLYESPVPRSHERYLTNVESQQFVRHRRKQSIKNIQDQPCTCEPESVNTNASGVQKQNIQKIPFENQRQNGDTVNFSPLHPRAQSQIDYISTTVIDNYVHRTKSWAGPPTRSHIYDGFSSSSEDYTTTDLNYSDLNEEERVLCDNLEQSGSITDIVDHLIQEDYLSNDDWCAINEIKVKRNQATYVAKRISNKIRQEGLDNFSNMLKNQPGLSKWLATKFREPVENVCRTENHPDAECKHGHRNNSSPRDEHEFSCQAIDQIDGVEKISYCNSPENNGSSAVALCSNNHGSKEAFPCPENICPPEMAVDKHFQKVFDSLNTAFNKGTLPVTHLPNEPNVKCIVLYLKACDALYKTQLEDAERYIKLAEAAVDDTDCPTFMRGEIFTQKTWLCLRTNRLGMMERLLEEHEQFLLANPNIWSNKAAGWFYFDYGRFYVRMMTVTKPSRPQRQKRSQTHSKTAYDVYKAKATACLKKSIDFFAHSDSSDGPIGMGFAMSLLASVELECVTDFGYLNSDVSDETMSEAVNLLQTVANLYDEIPEVVKSNYLWSKSDLCFRKNELDGAKELVEECVELSNKLSLKDELRECDRRLRLLKYYVYVRVFINCHPHTYLETK